MNTVIDSINVSGLGIHLRMPQSNTNVLDLANQALNDQEILLQLCAQDSATKYLVGGRVKSDNRSKYRRTAMLKNIVENVAMITPRSFGFAVVSAPIQPLVQETLPVGASAYGLPDFDASAKRNVRIKQASQSTGMEIEMDDDAEKAKESFDSLVEKEIISLKKNEMKRIKDIDEEIETHRYEATYFAQAYKTLTDGGIVAWIVERVLLDQRTLDRFHTYFEDVEVFRMEDDVRLVFIGKRRKTTYVQVVPEARAQAIYRFGLEKETLPLLGENDTVYYIPSVEESRVTSFRVGTVSEQEIVDVVSSSRLLGQALSNQLDTISFDTVAPAPLQKGHLVQLLTSGVINSYIGEGLQQHLVKGQSIKMLSTKQSSEEDTVTTTETDFYSVKLKLLLPNGDFHTIR